MLHFAAYIIYIRDMASKYRLSVNVSEQEYVELSALAEKHQVSMAWLGRQAIQDFIREHFSQEQQLPLVLTIDKIKRD